MLFLSTYKEYVMNRYLKLENIIIDDRNNIKLIDFGFTDISYSIQKLTTCCGTPIYMSPAKEKNTVAMLQIYGRLI